MPYLQLDLPQGLDSTKTQQLARALAECYAQRMQTQASIPAVCVRHAAGGGPYRLEDGTLREVAVLMCDVRQGRDAARREDAARALAALVAAATGLDSLRVVVEFTQHDPSEMFRYGAMAPAWDPGEAGA